MRRVPLKPGKPLQRKARMKKVNKERLEKRRAEEFGPQAQLCRESACCVPGCRLSGTATGHKSHPHHIKTRAAGGRDSDTVPLCGFHHAQVHRWGVGTFEELHGISFAAIAEEMQARVAEASDE